MTGGDPAIPPPRLNDDEPCPSRSSNADCRYEMLNDNLLDTASRQVLDQDLIKSFLDMQAFILWREHHIRTKQQPSIIESKHFYFRCWSAQHLATAHPFTNLSENPHPLQEPCRIAILIFCHASMQTHFPGSMVYRTLASQLRSALQIAFASPSVWDYYHDLLWWILLLGAFITDGLPKNLWFITVIAHGQKYTGASVPPWEEVEGIVARFLYIDRVFATGFKSTWDRVLALSDTMASTSGR